MTPASDNRRTRPETHPLGQYRSPVLPGQLLIHPSPSRPAKQGQLLLLQGCTLLQMPLPADKAGPQESPQQRLLSVLYQYLEGCRPQWNTHGCAAAANPDDGSIPLHAPNLEYL